MDIEIYKKKVISESLQPYVCHKLLYIHKSKWETWQMSVTNINCS